MTGEAMSQEQVLGGVEGGGGVGVGGEGDRDRDRDTSGAGGEDLASKFGDMETLRRVFGPYGFGGGGEGGGEGQDQPVPLNIAGPNTLEWANKTYMNEVSEYYWNRATIFQEALYISI
jgi:hypothetical protein